MRHLTKIALVLLIVGFPLASWYYLNTGLEYRKTALKLLAPKGVIDTKGIFPASDFKGYTTVLFSGDELRDDMLRIYDQYEEAHTFHMTELTSDTVNQAKWEVKMMSADDINLLLDEHLIQLIDTEMQVRQKYTTTKEDITDLIEHIAIVLPREEEPDIVLKNKNGE